MPYAIGLAVALAVVLFAATIGFDRDRAFYPTVLVVIAFYYVLFACMAPTTNPILPELAAAAVFTTLAAIGFKHSLWIVAAATAGHGVFDLVHHLIIDDPGVPLWWPAFCSAADIGLGAALAFLLARHADPSKP